MHPFHIAVPIAILSCALVGESRAQSPDGANSLETVQAQYAELSKDARGRIVTFQERYVEELDKLAAAARENANLDLVLAIKGEKEFFRTGQKDFSPHPELKKLQEIYRQHSTKLHREVAETEIRLATSYIQKLGELQNSFTRENKIDEAVNARAEIEKMEALVAELESQLMAAKPVSRPDYVPDDAVLFQGVYYKFYDELVDWNTAVSRCKKMKGMLATTPSEEIYDHVLGLAENRMIWLGATDEKKEGEWKWLDGSPVVWSNWQSGEPTNSFGAEHSLRTTDQLKWGDTRATATQLVYVCMWPAE